MIEQGFLKAYKDINGDSLVLILSIALTKIYAKLFLDILRIFTQPFNIYSIFFIRRKSFKKYTAMLTPRELDDVTLLAQFENCSLHPNFFTHENLLRLSWILINKFGLEKAIVKNRSIKEKYFKEVLKSDKFNIPLTVAYTEILHHFMEKSHSNDFYILLKEFPRLKYNFKLLVKTHYGYDILKEHRRDDIQPKRPILFTF